MRTLHFRVSRLSLVALLALGCADSADSSGPAVEVDATVAPPGRDQGIGPGPGDVYIPPDAQPRDAFIPEPRRDAEPDPVDAEAPLDGPAPVVDADVDAEADLAVDAEVDAAVAGFVTQAVAAAAMLPSTRHALLSPLHAGYAARSVAPQSR